MSGQYEITWSRGWIEALDGEYRPSTRARFAKEITRIDRAEARFFVCSPAARTQAKADCADYEEWKAFPDYCEALVYRAELIDSESKDG